MESKICQYEEKEDEYRDAKFVSYLNDNNVFFKKICHDIRNSKQFSKEIIEKINKLSYENSIADDYQPTFHIDLFKNAQPLETLSDFATT